MRIFSNRYLSHSKARYHIFLYFSPPNLITTSVAMLPLNSWLKIGKVQAFFSQLFQYLYLILPITHAPTAASRQLLIYRCFTLSLMYRGTLDIQEYWTDTWTDATATRTPGRGKQVCMYTPGISILSLSNFDCCFAIVVIKKDRDAQLTVS